MKKTYRKLKDFKEYFPEFGQQIEDIVKDTGFEIKGFFSTIMVEGSHSVHVLSIEHNKDHYGEDLEIVEQRVEEFKDEGNPAGSVIWFYGTGIITLTGFM